MLRRLFARDPKSRRRLARYSCVGTPRKNGKTALIAGVALYGLLCEDDGAEVYAVAGDRDQARILFGTAKRMVELDGSLSAATRLYRDAIEVPGSGSVMRVLSSEAPLKEGLSPTLTVVDELHVIDEELWNVFALAMGARTEPLMLGITTAGVRYGSHGRETIAYRLYQHGQRLATGEERDPAFYFEWWGAPDDADYRDPAVWAMANPSLGDILDPADLEAAIGSTEEHEVRTKRLNIWVASSAAAIPTGAWEACAAPTSDGVGPLVIGFDGSWSGDSTAIVGATVSETPHLVTLASWERPVGDLHWRVDSGVVEAELARIVETHDVVEIACDPYHWRSQIESWAAAGWPVTEWPTASLPRIGPAWKEFYAAILERRLTHDADPRLARHVANAVLKIDRNGARPTKEHGSSGRKIDLLIAALIAHDRATARAKQASAPTPEFIAL